MKARPMTMVTTPPIRMRVSALSRIDVASPKTDIVISRNTAVKPATKRIAAPMTRQRPARAPAFASSTVAAGASAPTSPARYDR